MPVVVDAECQQKDALGEVEFGFERLRRMGRDCTTVEERRGASAVARSGRYRCSKTRL